jgi:hypothetical protein
MLRCQPPEQECRARCIHSGMRTAVQNQSRNPLLSPASPPESLLKAGPVPGARAGFH